MSRTSASLPTISEGQRQEVETLLRQRTLSPRVRERLEMVKAVALGYDLEAIVGWTGRSPGRIQHWVQRFVTIGVAGLADHPRAGRPPKADAAYRRALAAAVTAGPRACGGDFDVWTTPRLSAYLAEQTGVTVAPGWLRTLLGREDFSWGRPKHTVKHLQDPQEVAACREVLAEVGEKGAPAAGEV